MGLLLSVLVACVGVVELLTFFSTVRRNAQPIALQTDLETVRNGYLKDLYDLRDRVYTDLQELLGNNGQQPQEEERKNPMVRLTSHEDIELEYNNGVVSRSRTSSPRRFLLTEKVNRSRSPSPRQFLVMEEPQALNGNDGLPEFLIEERKCAGNGVDGNKRYLLKDVNGVAASLPLPNQFVVTEDIPRNGKSRSHSPECKEFVRSPSPYPKFEVTAPRNSICAEMVESSIVSVLEVDEELSKSKSPTPEPAVAIELESSTYNSTEYWTNSVLMVPEKKKSKSPSPTNGKMQECDDKKEEDGFDENFLNGLDGIKRNVSSRRSIKRKKSNEARKLDVASTSQADKEPLLNTEHTLNEAAKELRKISTVTNDIEKKSNESITKEAFWVGNN